jgi:hypothetical protein
VKNLPQQSYGGEAWKNFLKNEIFWRLEVTCTPAELEGQRVMRQIVGARDESQSIVG